MNTREQFGNYLLLKKLTEDSLGETFRAGLVGAKGMERVVLLRVFNGQGLDGPRLWEASHERAGLQQVLKSPNIGEGVDLGEIQGIPYVAYDYVSGKNLATLCDQATKKRNPIPTEHALLITERIALGLAVAAEHRLGSDRILHGFLVPHLVMISNEGEARVLGFEMAPGLRGFAAANPVVRQHFGRYLAPEALSGAAPQRSDDIYSLGALMFELLAGTTLPPPAADGYGSVIDQAKLATDGEPIPAELAQLLKQSLAAREQRISDVVAWHKTLNRWMFDGQYNPTTFNLAFFMHNLFRQEIERESQEIEVEKTLPLPIVAPPPSGPISTPVGTVSSTVPVAAQPETQQWDQSRPVTTATATAAATTTGAIATAAAPTNEGQGSSSKLPLILLSILLLGAIGGGIWWWLGQRGGDGSDTPTVTAEQTTPPLATAAASTVATAPATGTATTAEENVPSEEEQAALQAQIDALVNQKASDMESQLRSQMDAQLETLRTQLTEAQSVATERDRLLEEQRQRQEAEAEQERKEAEAAAEVQRLADEEAARQAAAEQAARDAEAEAARKAAEEAAKKPIVRRGDLVQPGPGIKAPKLVRVPPARFPEMARRLNKGGVVVAVKVLVDENGKVIDSKLDGKKVGFGFDTEAMSVARNAFYEPAKAEKVPVKMWVTLRVSFQ